MWALVVGMCLGAALLFFGIMVGIAVSERGADRSGAQWRDN